MYQGEVIFDKNNNHVRRLSYWVRIKNIADYTAVKAKPFYAALKFKKVESTVNGYSYIKMESTKTGRIYYMFTGDFNDAVEQYGLSSGMLIGLFVWRKNGDTTGVKMISNGDEVDLGKGIEKWQLKA